ncbi:MAG: HPr family phosphocarrier protein [Gammaproteobacteria bacterium]|nr:HPr family phosphocarrier protein [Gammaproteobacteria bacterium]MXW50617.1 HPr family phosphocarrier protein [Gammaproteobacteria bacterium]MXY06698.1 HPr family phosphocarrier protein [Gammaproteobacteria bacterium]MYE51024.1 HPr family phosphocarrier protein [Gammaproteobacteria bacterium]MYF11747.1 HPr family phosphocarrier protein [Gammaproteobacteria bacterium]
MKRTQVTLSNQLGLHARAAAKLVHLAKTFTGDIQLGKDGTLVDAKSIMSVLLLAAPVGTTLELRVDGEDEAEAFAAIRQLIDDRFGEEV